jgi:hypothetical protein
MSGFKEYFTAPLKQTRDPDFTGVFVRMWIAGTMGAYFTFLFRNLALDLPTFSIHDFDCSYTLVVWIRYAYLLWFLAYFFASNVRYERNKKNLSAWDVGFDLTQAVIGIVAAFYLGFIVRAADRGFADSTSSAVEAANAGIALICIFSLICFGWRKDAGDDGPKLNHLRRWGLVSSVLALAFVILAGCVEGSRVWARWVAVLFGSVPFIALWRFIRIQWKPQTSPAPGEARAAAQ